jgi:hypothetical protein
MKLNPSRVRRGRFKPNGIPKIDYSHPLAVGLIYYAIDTGTGIVELIGQSGLVFTNGTKPSYGTSPFGAGYKYTSLGAGLFGASLPSVVASVNTASFSTATAIYITSLPSVSFTTPFGMDDASGGSWSALVLNNSANTDMCYSVENANPGVVAGDTTNAFHTLVGVNTGTNAQTFYLDGAVAATTTTTNTSGHTEAGPCFNNFTRGSIPGGNGIVGWIYYGAHWNRSLSATEAKLLHDDPYCFLVFPQDLVFAEALYTKRISNWSTGTNLGTATGTDAQIVTVAASAVAGSLVVVVGDMDASVSSFIPNNGTASDSKGNIYTRIGSKALNATNASGGVDVFQSVLTTGLTSGVDTITYTPPGNGNGNSTNMSATAWTNSTAGATIALDLSVSATGTGSTPSSGASGAPTQIGELFVGIVDIHAITSGSQTPGFQSPPNRIAGGLLQIFSGQHQDVVTNAYTYNPTGLGTGAWAAFIFSFNTVAAAAAASIGITPPNIFRPRQGPSRGLFTQRSTFIPGVTTISLTSYSLTQAKAFAPVRGSAAIAAIGKAQAEARAAAGAAAALAAKGASQGKASAAPIGAAAIASRAEAMAKASASPSGVVPLTTRGAAQAKAVANLFAGILLSARSAAQAKASAAGTFALALATRATAMAKASGSTSGTVGLSALAKAQVQARAVVSATANLVALAGTATSQAKSSAVLAAKASLLALGAAQAKTRASAAAAANLTARGTAMAKATALASGSVLLSALGKAQAQARNTGTFIMAFTARGTAQAKAVATVNAIAALTALSALGKAMASMRGGPLSGVGPVGKAKEWLLTYRRRRKR